MTQVSLRAARENMRLSQVKLAEKAGIGRDHYGRVERGEEPLTDALTDKLADVLKVDPWEINPSYIGPSKIELDLLQRLRRVERHKRQSIWPMLLAMLDEASRSSAA